VSAESHSDQGATSANATYGDNATPIGQRILIIGSSNAGKTTLGRHLAVTLNIPFTDLDDLHWEPGWRVADDEVFRGRVRAVVATDAWVIAGSYISKQQDVSWPAAETIIWLDLPLSTVFTRCVRRCWTRWRTQEVLQGGNRERFREHLMLWAPEKSLPGYILRTHRERRRIYAMSIQDSRFAHVRFIRLRSPADVDHLLEGIETTAPLPLRERGAE
jgi:adenylate kinase family enzyme